MKALLNSWLRRDRLIMPVRIYDISKKLGLENKEVLAKAKELGIAAARVASSSLDKITAEYLEDQLGGSSILPLPPPPRLLRRPALLAEPAPPPPPQPPARSRRPVAPSARSES